MEFIELKFILIISDKSECTFKRIDDFTNFLAKSLIADRIESIKKCITVKKMEN